jgi:hypothetical protein
MSPSSTLAKQLGDGERMNCENMLSSLRAPSADEGFKDGDVCGRHPGFIGTSFVTGLPCMLSTSKRQVSAVDGLSVNSGRGELQSIVVSKLKTEDGQTVGLVVRDFSRGLPAPGIVKASRSRCIRRLCASSFEWNLPACWRYLERILQSMALPIRRSGPAQGVCG